jgi:hypothetical protein
LSAGTADVTVFTYDHLDRMLHGRVQIDLPCPVCGPNARLPFNRRRKVFRLRNPRPGFISWDCRRCGIKGGIGDGSAPRPVPTVARIERERQVDDGAAAAFDTMRYAHSLFRSGQHLKDTPAEIYLNSRAISLEKAGDLSHVMRFAPVLPLDGKRVCGIISLFRDIRTNEPRGVHRIFLHPDGRPALDADGSKIKRMLGPAADAAIKLDPDEDVTIGLHIGEGVETCLSARQLGFHPVWAMGSAGAVEAFPLLAGLDAISVFGENGERAYQAARTVCRRYRTAGLDAVFYEPRDGDINDRSETKGGVMSRMPRDVLEIAAAMPPDAGDAGVKAYTFDDPLDRAIDTAIDEIDAIAERLILIRFRDIKLDMSPRFLVDGIIPREGLTVVWGPRKQGKSFWTFDLTMHVACGWTYRGHDVVQGTVVYCYMEGQSAISARVDAYRQHHHNNLPKDPDFILMPVRMELAKEHLGLIRAIQRMVGKAPAAIVIDTLNRSYTGSESSDADMTAYVKAADAVREMFACAVIVVHHCGHDETRPRGHTALRSVPMTP